MSGGDEVSRPCVLDNLDLPSLEALLGRRIGVEAGSRRLRRSLRARREGRTRL